MFLKFIKNNGNNSFIEHLEVGLPGVSGAVAWGDYDNDGDLDLLLTGSSDTGNISKIYKNVVEVSNTPPSIPTGLVSIANTNSVTLQWNKATDAETPSDGLTYNICITDSGLSAPYRVSPMSDITTGYRKIIQMGNAQKDTSRIIKDLPLGTYIWYVQAIDNGFTGSVFSETKYFTIVLDNIEEEDISGEQGLTFTIYPNPTGSQFTIDLSNDIYKEIHLQIIDITGKLIYTDIIEHPNPQITINLNNVAPGLYYLQLKADNQNSIVRKIVITSE